MGCDIHGFVEVRRHVDGEIKWVCASFLKHCPYWKEGDDLNEKYDFVNVFGHRNYNAFTQLCGVRDYTEGCTPISPPRGIPDDVSDPIKKEAMAWGSDGHSHSYVTLQEVISYRDDLPPLKQTGLLDAHQREELKKGTLPTSWCQETTRPGYERCYWDEMYDGLLPLQEELIKYAEDSILGGFDPEKDTENVRFVFWFDN